MKRSILVGLFVLVVAGLVGSTYVSLKATPTGSTPQTLTAGQKLLAEQHAAGKVKFQTMHYADSLAFMLKHIEKFRNDPKRTSAQVRAIDQIVAKLDVKTYSKGRDAGKHAALKAEGAKARALFTEAEWNELGRPSLASLAVGVMPVRRSVMCSCSSSDNWCSNGGNCSANGRCDIWPWGCGWLLLDTCDGSCAGGSDNGCPLPVVLQ